MAPRINLGLKCVPVVVLCLSGLISLANSAKLSGSKESDAGDSSLETLLLRDKLNLILDAESREVTLLKNLLDESQHEAQVSSSPASKENEHSYKSGSESWPTVPTTTTPKSSSERSTLMSVPPTEKTVGRETSFHSLEYLREHGIVSKLEENSKRMEKMVVFLVDLRNLLTEALTSQNRQMAFESEMVEIREEMEYLRKELQTLKRERRSSSSSSSTSSFGTMESRPNLENRLHNEEATIQWLKDSTTELKAQMRDISESCNITVIAQLKEQMDKEALRRHTDLAAAEKQLETLRLKQLRQDEQIYEAKANIEDVRSWQVKMGQRLIENKSTAPDSLHGHDDDLSNDERSNSIEFGGEEHFITEALKESAGKPVRHWNKRLKAKVHELQTIIQDLVKDNKNHERRLGKIENSQRSLKSMTNSLRETFSQTGLIPKGEMQPGGSNSRLSKRISGLEKTMQEYIITLENLNDKVGAVEELQESSTQLFRALETLETKYDERVNELQTGVARLDSSASSMNVVNQDLKEQQTQQSSLMQTVKKELFQMKGKLQTNHLRLASVQSQMVKWAAEKCSDENTESIQNIRIATLENDLLDMKQATESI